LLYRVRPRPYDGSLLRARPIKAIAPRKETVIGSDMVFTESLNLVFVESVPN